MSRNDELSRSLKVKLTYANEEAEGDLREKIDQYYSMVKYTGARMDVPNFQEVANTIVSIIRQKEDRFIAEIARVFSITNASPTEHELAQIKDAIARYFDEERYIQRFDSFMSSVERKVASYGLTFEPDIYRVDLASALYLAGVTNCTRHARAAVLAELGLYSPTLPEVLTIKPGYGGVNIDLRALLIRGKRIWPGLKGVFKSK